MTSDPTERERLARLPENDALCKLMLDAAMNNDLDEATVSLKLLPVMADKILAAGYVREGAPRTPAPHSYDGRELGGKMIAMFMGSRVDTMPREELIEACGWAAREIVRLGEKVAALEMESLHDASTIGTLRGKLHNSHPSLDQSAAKSSDAVAVKTAGRGEGET